MHFRGVVLLTGSKAEAAPVLVRSNLKTRAAWWVCAATMIMLPVAVAAQGRVGVTSQTDGDPLGRPPSASERVLRVGIDIQANETITTKSDDRAHLVFLDGTSLTVAPNAQLVIDRFVYDPNSKTGDLAISVTTGVFRLVGGKISKSSPIVVNTPSASIGVRGGIGLFAVTSGETKAHFLYGTSLSVAANGQTQVATRPSSMIVARFGSAPGAPTLIPPGALVQTLTALETRSAGGRDATADSKAKTSGFSARNSDQGPPPKGGGSTTLVGQANNAIQAVSTVNQQRDVLTTQPATSSAVVATGSMASGPGMSPPPPPPPPPPPLCPPPHHEWSRSGGPSLDLHGRR
jgi:hypothetical protein